MGHCAAVWDCKAAMEVTKDWNGIDQIVLRNPRGESVRVSLHGGQVTSWRNERGEELLFSSSKGILKPPKAIRGGIPICFPQPCKERNFIASPLQSGKIVHEALVHLLLNGSKADVWLENQQLWDGEKEFLSFENCGSVEQNGFARNKMWIIDENAPPLPPNDSQGKSFVDLLLKPSHEDMKCWPHSFEFRLRVSLAIDGKLNLISRIRNIHGRPFTFTFAYHTYLAVSDISEVRIEGLETLDYLDNLIKKERFTEQGNAITFESELDRVYLHSSSAVAVLDHQKKRTFVIRREGLPDVVVWNPWEKKSKSLVDFGATEYKQMVCVNGAAIEKPITLKPGEEWKGRLELMVVPSSFCSEGLLFP